MVFRTLLLTIMTSLLAFAAAALPNSGTTIQCSDSEFQDSINRIKTSAQILNRPLQIKSDMPIEVYGTINQLSQGTFEMLVVSVGEEMVSIGPTYFEGSIRVNKKYFSFLKGQVKSAHAALNFVLAHELAHHVESLYSKNIDRKRNSGGYEFSKFTNDFEREVYMHAHTDCLGLSLMRNAGMKIELDAVADALITIKDECYEYRGKQFCESAHAVRLEHVKRWFDSIKDTK